MANLAQHLDQAGDFKLRSPVPFLGITQKSTGEHDRLDLLRRWGLGEVRMNESRVNVVHRSSMTGLLRAVKVNVKLTAAVVIGESAGILKLGLKGVKCA